jgi:ribonuclease G
MSKELVISSNRHETKVAILEDDQLVEVYFQRSNEYGLAGSVHKGRVTRVLPGMQSAFVDLGLERDTFLYVSDFLEEAEDYDRIETTGRPERSEGGERERDRDRDRDRDRGGRRGRGERGERGGGRYREPAGRFSSPPPPPPDEVGAPAIEEPVEPSEPLEVVPEAEAVAPVVAAGEAAQRERPQTDDDRRGRRSRRRRRGGRGFPESKYASAESRGSVDAGEAPAEEAVGPASGDDMMLLPGESLAKYRAPHQSAGSETFETESGAVDDYENDVLPPELAAIPNDNPEELPPVNAIPDAPVHEIHMGAAPALESVPHPQPAVVVEPQVDDEDLAAEDVEAGDQDDSSPMGDESAPIGDRVVPIDDEEDREIQALILHGEAEEIAPAEETGESTDEDQRSASVREQGGRYLHRVSRRMRRRMRGGPPESAAPAPVPTREPGHEPRPVEPRPVEPRIESRPEPREVRGERRPDRTPTPSITDLLKEGQEIIVQIAKEPLGQKGARITSHIALPGRFVVYMPTLDHMGVSRKIASDEERQRLKRILQKHRVGISGGYIIRTAGEGKSEEDIAADMTFLANLWLDIRQKAEKHPAPILLHHDLDIVQRILRDQVNDSFKSVWVDNEEMYESILRFLQRFQPTMVSRVKLYTRPAPIYDAFNVTAELEKALRPKVWLKSGGYIVINQTEALVAIDVNTGKYVGKSNRLEDTIVKTNTEAVKEIVRQIRLRDLGGIIVIDFIDMDERKNRQKVMQALEDAMRADRAPYKILQFNDFGLVAITRKRVKQSLERTLCAPCPYCEGAGYVKSVQTIIGEILQEAQKIAKAVEGSDVVLRVHPDVAKVLKSHHNRYLEELEDTLKRPVLVTSDASLHHEKFDLA